MAKKAKKGIRDMDAGEMGKALADMNEQAFRIRFQLKMGQTAGLKRLREIKKERARLLTEQRARELGVVEAGR